MPEFYNQLYLIKKENEYTNLYISCYHIDLLREFNNNDIKFYNHELLWDEYEKRHYYLFRMKENYDINIVIRILKYFEFNEVNYILDT